MALLSSLYHRQALIKADTERRRHRRRLRRSSPLNNFVLLQLGENAEDKWKIWLSKMRMWGTLHRRNENFAAIGKQLKDLQILKLISNVRPSSPPTDSKHFEFLCRQLDLSITSMVRREGFCWLARYCNTPSNYFPESQHRGGDGKVEEAAIREE